jgi:hypothetical protein
MLRVVRKQLNQEAQESITKTKRKRLPKEKDYKKQRRNKRRRNKKQKKEN